MKNEDRALCVVVRNHYSKERGEQQRNLDEKIKIEDNPYFTFEVQSPNSMIKDYNLEFALPSGNIGNMYAIQGLGVGDSLFSTNPRVKQAIATGVFDKDLLRGI